MVDLFQRGPKFAKDLFNKLDGNLPSPPAADTADKEKTPRSGGADMTSNSVSNHTSAPPGMFQAILSYDM
jgi:hypothetical protein